MTSAASDPALIMLAQRAGILTRWEDASGQPKTLTEDVLRDVLQALDLDCATPGQIKDSLQQLEHDQHVPDGGLLVVRCGERPRLRSEISGGWMLKLESGKVLSGKIRQDKAGWISLSPVMEPGYHRLEFGERSLTLAVTPGRCPDVPAGLPGRPRPWGLVAQIYSLQHAGCDSPPWLQGGSFTAAEKLAVESARTGASALALSPAHAMFSADPARYSPYSPSSRLWLNVVYADPVHVLGADIVQHVLSRWSLPDRLYEPRRGLLLDWPRIAALRLRLLRDVFACFRERGTDAMKARLESFCRQGGTALKNHAVYEALHTHHAAALGAGHGWQDWTQPLQDPASAATVEFARQHAEEVDFHIFAQWLASEGLQRAQARARSAGMSCGLISDLAIGTDPRGSHAWSLQDEILTRVSVGAPPDLYQARGQNWGLTAFSPRGLRRGAYSAFIATLRAGLGSAGGIRIDHIAGMERLWLIPAGATAVEGAYLTYPKRDLLGLITLEACRHHAIVIGENLGTVSDTLNQALVEHGMLGTSVLWFERQEMSSRTAQERRKHASKADVSENVVSWLPPEKWSENAIAMPSTHDLPTLHGWWQERDLQWQALLNPQGREQREATLADRKAQRADLWQTIQHTAQVPVTPVPETTPLNAMLGFVARTPAPLALFSMEDLLGVLDQPNMPGGEPDQGAVYHPNWLQQLPMRIEDTFSGPGIRERIQAITMARSLP